MEGVHCDIEEINRIEMIELHAEDRGEEPHSSICKIVLTCRSGYAMEDNT